MRRGAGREELKRFLDEQTVGLGRLETIERLLQLGVVAPARCEQAALRCDVERLVARGVPRCEAMEAVAMQCGCSYAKVKGAVYYRAKC